jgi:hypothetical protein
MSVTYRRIESTDPRLKRHVRHDDRSRDYPFDTSGLTIVSAKHTRRIPVLDQGQLGSCTGNAGIGCLGTDPYYATLALPTLIKTSRSSLTMEDAERVKAAYEQAARTGRPLVLSGEWQVTPGRTMPYSLDEAGAVQLYSDATKLDDYPGGYYAPDWSDTGSDGLSIAKALKNAGEIGGYQHTFSLDDALKALGVTPYITGTNWTSNMFDPDSDGRVYPTGSVEGGHEYVADEIDAANEQVWFTNSWGQWGVTRDGRPGRFYMTFADFGDLLGQQGDVTIFVPLTQPAPTPVPPTPTPAPVVTDADRALAAALRHNNWVHHPHITGARRVAHAALPWLTEKGL